MQQTTFSNYNLHLLQAKQMCCTKSAYQNALNDSNIAQTLRLHWLYFFQLAVVWRCPFVSEFGIQFWSHFTATYSFSTLVQSHLCWWVLFFSLSNCVSFHSVKSQQLTYLCGLSPSLLFFGSTQSTGLETSLTLSFI